MRVVQYEEAGAGCQFICLTHNLLKLFRSGWLPQTGKAKLAFSTNPVGHADSRKDFAADPATDLAGWAAA
jgi:hypothetical protein